MQHVLATQNIPRRFCDALQDLGRRGFSAVEGNREETSVGMPLQRAALSLARPGSQGLNTLVTPKTFGVDKQA